MDTCLLVLAGVMVLMLMLCAAWRWRHTASRCISCVLLGIFFGTFFMVLPTAWYSDPAQVYSPLRFRLLSTLLHSLKTLGGRQSITQYESIALYGGWKTAYIALNYLMTACAPIITSSLILSCFADMGEKLRYVLHPGGDCHVFSELNANSLRLAEGLRKKRSGVLVFCDTKSADAALITQAKRLGGICLYQPITDFGVSGFHRHYTFYLISMREEENIAPVRRILARHSAVAEGKLTVNAFARSGASICVAEEQPAGNVRVRFLDEVALFCDHLLFRYPLFALPEGQTKIFGLVIGCGRTGEQMLRSMVWAGQINGLSLKLRGVDVDPSAASRFFAAGPELRHYDLDIFGGVDACGEEFLELLEREKLYQATYVVIATADDDLNIEIATRLRAEMIRLGGEFDRPGSRIFMRVRDDVRAENLRTERSSYLEKRNIHIFGDNEELFSEPMLLDSKLERLTYAVALSYQGALEYPEDSPEFREKAEECRKDFWKSEYGRRSSMAAALHIPAKVYVALRDSGCGESERAEALNELSGRTAELYEEALTKGGDRLLEALGEMEHERWCAFLRSEGWRSTDRMLQFAGPANGYGAKWPPAKLHACLIPWQELNALSDTLNEAFPTRERSDFRWNDLEIVRRLPQMLRLSGEASTAGASRKHALKPVRRPARRQCPAQADTKAKEEKEHV